MNRRMNDADEGFDWTGCKKWESFQNCNKTINRWREPITLIISEKMTTGNPYSDALPTLHSSSATN